MRHSQMVNIAKHALSSKVSSSLFTQACKLLPGYFLFLSIQTIFIPLAGEVQKKERNKTFVT